MSLLLLLRNGSSEPPPEPEVLTPNRTRVVERPPMRQSLIATSPNGAVRRWAEDEPDAANVLEEMTDSGTAPGGDKSLTAKLPRRPGVDYSDMSMGTRLQVLGAGGQTLSEYRLERAPRTSGDYLVMDPAASGYQVLLSDKEEAREIFIDAELGAWGDAPIERRKQLVEQKVDLAASQSIMPGSTTEPAGVGFDFANVETNSEREQAGESWYDAQGIWIHKLIYFFRAIGGYDVSDTAHWLDYVGASVDDRMLAAEYGENHCQNTNAAPVQFTEPYTGRSFAVLQSRHIAGVSGNTMNGIHAWQAPKVIGFHELPIYGSWPEIGVLASDVIAYAISKWAPGLRFTTGAYGSILPSRFLIPHLVFKEPTTVLEMITQALKYELLEWGVWPGQFGPTFHLNERGKREGAKEWRTRIRPAKLTETGEQMDQIYNRVVMSWRDSGGTTRTLGPVGSGYPLTDSRCEDRDPENPLNEAGVIRTKHLTMEGVGTVEAAAEQSRLFLEKCRLLNSSGEATITGYVEDERGIEWPYYMVGAGDTIRFLDASIPGPRYIVEATRNRKTRSVNVKLDSPPDSYESLLAELQVRETAAGIS